MTMTPDELYRRANAEMTNCYESGIRCMETADSKKSVLFYRDYTEGEIDGIEFFSQSMYLTVIYDYDNENEVEETRMYKDYCKRVRDRSKDLKNLIIQYAVRFL